MILAQDNPVFHVKALLTFDILMHEMTFQQKLDAIIDKNNSLVCVGLDSEFEKLPNSVSSLPHSQFEFNKTIIDATHDIVCCYKPNTAFYEARGADGITDLKMTCDYITENYPEVVILLDAKRADIGNTNKGYVSFAFDYLQADAITLHPYLGKEAIQPFLDRSDKGCIILCRTSNPGGGELQDLQINNEPLYMHIAKIVSQDWNGNNNCLLVVGATYPEELKKIRAVASDMTFLIPGIGAQGGDLENTLRSGLKQDKKGLIISSSRAIIFADSPRDEAIKLRDEINSFRT